MKRIISLLLAVMMLGASLAACVDPYGMIPEDTTEADTTADTEPNEETDLPSDTTAKETEPITTDPIDTTTAEEITTVEDITTAEPNEETNEPIIEEERELFKPETPITLDLISNNKAKLKIVYPEGNAEAQGIAERIKSGILTKYSVNVDAVSDADEAADPDAVELLVGYTNREESEQIIKFVGYRDYALFVTGNKFIVAGWTSDKLAKAVEKLEKKFFTDNESNSSLSVSSEDNYVSASYYQYNNLYSKYDKANKIFGNYYYNYKIVIPEDYTISEYRFAQRLQIILGTKAGTVLRIVDDTAERTDYEILVGKTNRTQSSVGKNKYLIKAKSNSVEMLSDTYYGYDYMYQYCEANFVKNLNSAKAGRDTIVNNAYSEELTADGSESFLTKDTDIRVIFHNIGGFDVFPLTPNNSCMPEVRNPMVVEYYKDFKLDILCLEEITPMMRRVSDEEQIGTLFAKYGYAEVAPNVTHTFGSYRNIKTTTPIYYNTATLNLIAGGSKNYQEELSTGLVSELDGKPLVFQWDKFMSWAVFEKKTTNERFAVINVHFDSFNEDTDNNGSQERLVGEEKAKILTNFIIRCSADIISQYNCPVIIGGDMNTTISGASYQLYKSANYSHVREIAEKADTVRGHFTAYPAYTESISGGYFATVPGAILESGSYHDSVDHVYIDSAGRNKIEFKLFDVLSDQANGSLGDHSGMLIDFNFK